jgi:GAF domain-containing protein
VEHTLEQAVSVAVRLIRGCDAAGVTLVRHGQPPETPVCTADFVARGDALQYELGEGPCLDAVWEHEIVISTDLANEDRWTTWGPRVVEELGVRSMMCIQLFVEDEILGALNLYSRQEAGAFTRAEDRYEGQALATHISLALVSAQQIEDLDLTVVSRTRIGQAEGIVMERFDISAEDAFRLLNRVATSSEVGLFAVAEEIVRTRQIPTH